ncbi:hypothetical protein KQX54_007861 [Cotesia glomerata]|uniref:Uncharacterized protein n=1 Tax=Cotesia glomerata TaxID=32391 RepID=A0AAV7J895_COTGL|nr:hypothetical protein KQX54_007861 [Cotesia glomerata]
MEQNQGAVGWVKEAANENGERSLVSEYARARMSYRLADSANATPGPGKPADVPHYANVSRYVVQRKQTELQEFHSPSLSSFSSSPDPPFTPFPYGRNQTIDRTTDRRTDAYTTRDTI